MSHWPEFGPDFHKNQTIVEFLKIIFHYFKLVEIKCTENLKLILKSGILARVFQQISEIVSSVSASFNKADGWK